MLKLRSVGMNLSHVVKDLAKEYDVSPRTLYYDWNQRKFWLPILLEIKDPEQFFYDLIGNHKEISRLAMIEYLKGDNSAARIGALRLLRDLNKDLGELVMIQSLNDRVERLEQT